MNRYVQTLLLFALLQGIAVSTHAQDISLEWAHYLGTTNSDNKMCLTTDRWGNLLSAGYIYQAVDFDPGPGTSILTGNAYYNGLYVCKKDNAGNLLWAKQMGGAARSMVTDTAGNIYLAGYFSDKVDFNPSPAPADTFYLQDYITPSYTGLYDGFVCKLDSAGNLVWAKQFTGEQCYGNSLSLDPSGNVCITGTFNGTVDFDPGTGIDNHVAQGNYDAFICKLDASGNYVWAQSIGGPNAKICENGGSVKAGSLIDVDANGDVYIAGLFQDGEVDFDPGAGVANLASTYFAMFGVYAPATYVAKYSGVTGNYIWAKQLADDGYGTSELKAMSLDNTGNIHLAGTFPVIIDPIFQLDFDPGSAVYNLAEHSDFEDMDGFMVKLDPSGNFLWAKQIGGLQGDVINAISIDASNNIYATGGFRDTADFDPGTGMAQLITTAPANRLDIFMAKYNTSGDYIWSRSMGGTEHDAGYGITTDTANNVFCTGTFSTQADFGPDTSTFFLNSTNYSETFIAKYNECTHSTFDTTLSACDSLAWLGATYTQSGTYVQTIPNAIGCDSIITLHLTVNGSTTGTLTETACQSFTLGNQTYTNSGTFTQTIPNAAGCDSIITLNLTIKTMDTSVTLLAGILDANLIGATYQWINCNGNTPVSGATDQSFTPEEDGLYAVVLTFDGCTDTSSCHQVGDLNVAEMQFKNSIHIYPNPTSGKVAVTFSKLMSNSFIKCTHVNGQTVISAQAINSYRLELDLTAYPTGIYFLEIYNSEQKAVLKLIKE